MNGELDKYLKKLIGKKVEIYTNTASVVRGVLKDVSSSLNLLVKGKYTNESSQSLERLIVIYHNYIRTIEEIPCLEIDKR